MWTKETYNVEDVKKTDIIGVGVIRGKIFTDYGFDFSEEQIVNSYVNIIRKLEEKRNVANHAQKIMGGHGEEDFTETFDQNISSGWKRLYNAG